MMLRRQFVARMTAMTGSLATHSSVAGANDRICIGVIGCGSHGSFLMREALKCRHIEVVGVADVYTRRLEEARKLVPNTRTHLDYRHLLDDRSIDAVLIATPQHLHCEHFVASLDSGKHVYQEKTMAFTVEHAKQMRAAWQRAAGKFVVQIGHQRCSSDGIIDATGFIEGGRVGKITEIHAHNYRNTPHGKPQWSRRILPDMDPEHIIWKSFLGGAPARPFDANRYINWRFFWDYSGGNFYENMCHQLATWYKILKLPIPTAVTAVGGVYLWKDGREVPDTMSVAMEHSKELLFGWTSGFGNKHLGAGEYVLGTDGTITTHGHGGLRYMPEEVNRPGGTERIGRPIYPADAHRRHVEDFLDCIRTGRETTCPFELGFRVSIASRMAVESYRQRRTVRWDRHKEEIV